MKQMTMLHYLLEDYKREALERADLVWEEAEDFVRGYYQAMPSFFRQGLKTSNVLLSQHKDSLLPHIFSQVGQLQELKNRRIIESAVYDESHKKAINKLERVVSKHEPKIELYIQNTKSLLYEPGLLLVEPRLNEYVVIFDENQTVAKQAKQNIKHQMKYHAQMVDFDQETATKEELGLMVAKLDKKYMKATNDLAQAPFNVQLACHMQKRGPYPELRSSLIEMMKQAGWDETEELFYHKDHIMSFVPPRPKPLVVAYDNHNVNATWKVSAYYDENGGSLDLAKATVDNLERRIAAINDSLVIPTIPPVSKPVKNALNYLKNKANVDLSQGVTMNTVNQAMRIIYQHPKLGENASEVKAHLDHLLGESESMQKELDRINGLEERLRGEREYIDGFRAPNQVQVRETSSSTIRPFIEVIPERSGQKRLDEHVLAPAIV